MSYLANDPQSVNRDLTLLCPKFLMAVQDAQKECRDSGLNVWVFEAWRSPQRQAWLYAKGRFGDAGKIVTNAQEWQSWHQYGLAVDMVFKDENNQWTWNGNYDRVEEIFLKHGLEKGPRFEHAHFELTGGLDLALAKGLATQIGLPRVWLEVLTAVGLTTSADTIA